MMRPLTPQERDALIKLSERMPNDQRHAFLHDLENCLVESKVADASRLIFELPGYQRPPYHGQHAYPIEGLIFDEDGVDISVCVYADENDRLLELEFVKWGDAPVKSLNWDSFQILY
jgi:hypothetical protein